jgi:phosphatidylglycerophosphate synthase
VTVSARSDLGFRFHPPTVGASAQFVVLAALAVSVGLGVAGWLAGAVYAGATWALLSRALRGADERAWGPANSVTLARLTLAGGVTALVADSFRGPVPLAVLSVLAAVSLMLDAVDGQVARRTGSTSRLGARFDMEADSVLVLVLSVLVATSLGWWVVAIGAFRYAFVVVSWALPWLQAPLPPRMSRKVVAAVQGVVLVVASAGIMPVPAATVMVGLALATLVWSFGTDVRWLFSQVSTARATVAPHREPVPAGIRGADIRDADIRAGGYPVLADR